MFVTCRECTSVFTINDNFSGDTACAECGAHYTVSSEPVGLEVRAARPFDPEEDLSEDAREILGAVETQSLNESSVCAGYGAFVASEFMATRALEGFSCEITERKSWENAIQKLENDYPSLSGTIDYLRGVRNEVAHADKASSTESEAKETYYMVIRMINEISDKESNPV